MRLRLAFWVLTAAPVFGQQQTLQLTLSEAGRLAILNNPRLTSARFSAAAQHQVPVQARSAMLPNLSAAVTAVGADSGSRIAAGALNNPALYSRFGSGLILNQLVTDFGRTNNLVASAKFRAEAQDQVTETTRAGILLETARAYFGVLRAQAVFTVARQTVSARQLVSDQVTALANNKLKSGLDVSFANVNLADAQLLLVQAQNDLQSSEAQLANALGLPAQTAFSLTGESMPEALPESVDPLLQQAIQNRPELKDLRLQQNAAEWFARAEHALSYPSISIAGTAGLAPVGELPITSRYGGVGVNVTIPVFNGGLFHARQAEAELRAKAASANVNDLANRVMRDVRIAYLNAQTAFQRVGLTAQLLAQAQLGLDLAQGRYDLGLSSIVELSQAQLNLTSAQIANASARYEYQAQRVVVDYETGALR